MRLECDFWAVLQTESTPKAAGRQRFPRSAMPISNNGREKPPRTPGTMSKSGAVCCETVQKPPYEDETGAALRGDIGLTSIVMGTAFVETCDSGGRRQSRMASKRTFARRRTPQKAFARTENPKTAFARWTDPPKPHSPACQPTFSNQCTAAFHRATSRC